MGGVLFAFEEASSFWSLPLTWKSFFCAMTVRTRPGRASALRVSHSKLLLRGAFVWARRAPNNSQKRWFLARAVDLHAELLARVLQGPLREGQQPRPHHLRADGERPVRALAAADLSVPTRGVYVALAFFTVNRFSTALCMGATGTQRSKRPPGAVIFFAVVGGLLGAVFNEINFKLSIWRRWVASLPHPPDGDLIFHKRRANLIARGVLRLREGWLGTAAGRSGRSKRSASSPRASPRRAFSVRTHPGRLRSLSALHSKLSSCGGSVWARRGLTAKHGGFRPGQYCRRSSHRTAGPYRLTSSAHTTAMNTESAACRTA